MRHEVLVLGAGPVGLTTALLLARQGVRVALLEEKSAPDLSPSAVSLDDECLRIWQACGLERVLEQEWDGGQHNRVMCEYLGVSGRPFMQLRQQQSDLGYPHAVTIHLAGIVSKLWHKVEQDPSIELLTGYRVSGLEQDEKGVQIECVGKGATPSTFYGSWVVACDGKTSVTRTLLKIGMQGVSLPNPWLIAELEDDVSQSCVQIRCDPRQPSVTIPMPHNIRRVECMLLPEDNGAWLDDEAEVRHRLCAGWSGAADSRINAVTLRRFEARIATQWRSGRVFLAGDAAHHTPPFAGQGLGTGLRDASNLAFKLAGVRHGWLPGEVLDTYEQERRPHQERMIRLALRLGRVMAPKSRMQAFCVQSLIRMMMTIGPVRRHVQLRGPGIRPVLSDGFLRRGGKAGQYLPQPWVTTDGTRRVRFDTLLGPRMTWIATGSAQSPGRLPASLLSPSDTALIENQDFIDTNKQLQRRFGRHALVLVRPDRVIHTHSIQAKPGALSERAIPWFILKAHEVEPAPQRAASA